MPSERFIPLCHRIPNSQEEQGIVFIIKELLWNRACLPLRFIHLCFKVQVLSINTQSSCAVVLTTALRNRACRSMVAFWDIFRMSWLSQIYFAANSWICFSNGHRTVVILSFYSWLAPSMLFIISSTAHYALHKISDIHWSVHEYACEQKVFFTDSQLGRAHIFMYQCPPSLQQNFFSCISACSSVPDIDLKYIYFTLFQIWSENNSWSENL